MCDEPELFGSPVQTAPKQFGGLLLVSPKSQLLVREKSISFSYTAVRNAQQKHCFD